MKYPFLILCVFLLAACATQPTKMDEEQSELIYKLMKNQKLIVDHINEQADELTEKFQEIDQQLSESGEDRAKLDAFFKRKFGKK